MSSTTSTSDVDLVSAVLTREATRPRGEVRSPYSWGATLRLVPGHARGTAVAVLDALRRADRLVTAGRLAEFGRHGWAFGWIVGAAVAGSGERHDWPWWLTFAVGGASFVGGVWAIGWIAQRAIRQDGERRG